eukprot:5483995-Pyramimonas_sp.AAC.1
MRLWPQLDHGNSVHSCTGRPTQEPRDRQGCQHARPRTMWKNTMRKLSVRLSAAPKSAHRQMLRLRSVEHPAAVALCVVASCAAYAWDTNEAQWARLNTMFER